MSREFYQLIRSFGGLSLEYLDLVEADFAAVAGAAYVPPERGDFRRIVPVRTLQLLSETPGVVETFQTTSAFLRLPSNDAAEITNDAGDGRLFFFKNSGLGSITIQDYNGSNLFVAAPNIMTICVSNTSNSWDFYFTAQNISFDNTINGFTASNVQTAIEEVNAGSLASASPGFTWGRSGNVPSGAYLQNDSVPSNLTGRVVPVTGGEITNVFVANELASTFTVSIKRRDPGPVYTVLATVSLVALRTKTVSITGVPVSLGDEIVMQVSAGSCKNPVVGLVIKGSI